jgi:hypothetical protein
LNNANKAKLKIVCGTDIGSFPWTINQAKRIGVLCKKSRFIFNGCDQTATVNAAQLLRMELQLVRLKKDL